MLLDLLLPQRCVACASAGARLCDACRGAIRPLRPPLCARCGAPVAWPVERCRECSGRRLAFASARAAVAYDDPVRALVSTWKERAVGAFAASAADLVVEHVARPRVDALTFVPPDPDRRLRRRHHPPEALSRELARRWELPVVPLLVRTRAGPRQRGHDVRARRRNVADAFAPAARAPATVCLVDDVYTTGSTVAAAASALRRAGARRVEVATFARTIRVR